MIRDAMAPVIVPWRDGTDPNEVDRLLAALRAADRPQARVLRRPQRFIVSFPSSLRQRMLERAVQPAHPEYGDEYVYLDCDILYTDRTGPSARQVRDGGERGNLMARDDHPHWSNFGSCGCVGRMSAC